MKASRIPALAAACLLLSLLAAEAASAASSFRAKLTSGLEVTGELIDFSDGYYEFKVGQSIQRIKVEDLATLSLVRMAQVAPGSGASGGGTLVPEFTLRHGTGQSVTGRIIQFQDGYYDVATQSGNVRVPVANVSHVLLAWQQDTSGMDAAAPSSEPRVAKLSGVLRVRSSPEVFEKILPDLLQYYAKESGQTGNWSARRSDGSRTFTASASAGVEGLQVDIQIDDPRSAVEAVRVGEADLAFVGGALQDENLAKTDTPPEGDVRPTVEVETLGPSAAVVIVNSDNPIEQLTLDQVTAIFSGRITDWSELGGPHRRIRVHTLARKSGLDTLTKRTIMKDNPLLLSAYQVDTLAELSEIVSSDPTAISLTDAAHVGNAKALKIVDRCGIARAPDEFTLKLNAYPLSGTYAVYSAPDANPQTQGFRQFLTSEVTQGFLKSRGFPNDRVVAVRDPNLNIDVTADNIDTLPPSSGNAGDGAIERLSLVFNFDQGALAPKEGSESKVESLKAFFQERGDQKRRLALVGFSDTFGTLEQNVSVSRARARRVSRLLTAHGIETEKIIALGPKLPITCETVPGGAEMNRRVEIWLY